MTSDDRIEALEIALAHQEAETRDLSETVRAQWDEIDRLKAEIRRLTRSVEALARADDDEAPPVDQRPPHY